MVVSESANNLSQESLPSPASFPTDNIENQRGPTSPKADSDSHPPSTGAEESITIIYNTNGKSQPPNDGRQGGFTTPPSWDRDATAAANENTKNARIKYKGAPVGTLRKNWGKCLLALPFDKDIADF